METPNNVDCDVKQYAYAVRKAKIRPYAVRRLKMKQYAVRKAGVGRGFTFIYCFVN